MHHRTLTCALGVIALALASTPLYAHGGAYRGPGDVVPPGGGAGGSSGRPAPGGGSGPRTGRPGAPSTPMPPGPSTGPARPSGGNPVGAPTTRGGVPLTADLSEWKFWWEFNKHAYIGLREAVHTASSPTTGYNDIWKGFGTAASQGNLLEPTRRQIQHDILPALKRAIDSTEQRDIVSSCMIAMAKIGEDHSDFRLVDVFRARLSRDNQEIRETAALALGISAVKGEDALTLLINLALDSAEARKLSGRDISTRTRSFALYGLGLYANEHSVPVIKQRALAAMRSVLEDPSLQNRNLKVAAIEAMGMLAFDRTDPGSADLLDEAVDALTRYYERDLGVGQQLIQAHCPTAITKLIGRDHPRSDEFCQRFAEELDGNNRRRRNHNLARSCVLALGQLCGPRDDRRSRDAGYSELLVNTHLKHKDAQTRYFALLSLGQVGGLENRKFLLRILRKGNKVLERPWAALGLGVQAFTNYRRHLNNGETIDPDEFVGNELFQQLKKAKAPDLVGALGIALGLTRFTEAAPIMVQLIERQPAKQDQAGYLCLGLALMRDHASIESIQATMESAKRRPALFVQAAIALGLLGDKTAAEQLHRKLSDESSNLATLAAIAEALGQIGDRRSVAPLKQALFDEQRGNLQRAFAAVALGAVADRAPLPWHAEISTNINYRASVETLTNQQSGVLDLL